MLRRPLLASLAALLIGAAPALAQSSGDEQYQDPFGAPDQSEPEQTQPQSPPPASPAPSEPSQQSPESSAAPQPRAGPELARTGVRGDLLAAGGVLLLAAGLLLRRRLT